MSNYYTFIMASRGQQGACGHLMVRFDQHARCAHYRHKGQDSDSFDLNQNSNFCNVLTPEQVGQLCTPSYKLKKYKKSKKRRLIIPS